MQCSNLEQTINNLGTKVDVANLYNGMRIIHGAAVTISNGVAYLGYTYPVPYLSTPNVIYISSDITNVGDAQSAEIVNSSAYGFRIKLNHNLLENTRVYAVMATVTISN